MTETYCFLVLEVINPRSSHQRAALKRTSNPQKLGRGEEGLPLQVPEGILPHLLVGLQLQTFNPCLCHHMEFFPPCLSVGVQISLFS